VVTESFAPSPSEIGAARHFAQAAAEEWGCASADLGLVVSELATNACVHARSPFTVSLRRHGSRVVVEVTDEDPTPAVVGPPATGPSGRGMQIVAALACAWGVAGHDPGKSVWAVLDCPDDTGSDDMGHGALRAREPEVDGAIARDDLAV
jgi:Histidine kinase-like ATPase domain